MSTPPRIDWLLWVMVVVFAVTASGWVAEYYARIEKQRAINATYSVHEEAFAEIRASLDEIIWSMRGRGIDIPAHHQEGCQ